MVVACATGCASTNAKGRKIEATREAAKAAVRVKGWEEAFVLGVSELNRRGYRVDAAKCRMSLWRDKEKKVWIMTFRLIGFIGGSIDVEIDEDGTAYLSGRL